jgi:hypothetical protein
VNVTGTFPPYRQTNFVWLENVLGGVLFGIGMTLASGCGNKTLIRIGGGNLKSVMVLGVIGLIAYFMINPFPGRQDAVFHAVLRGQPAFAFHQPGPRRVLAAITRHRPGGGGAHRVLLACFKSPGFRSSFDNILGGLVVGLAVLAWYVTSNIA